MIEATKQGDGLKFVLEIGGAKRWFTKGVEDESYGRYVIENGKITVPVKGAALIGSGAEILLNIEKVCSNLSRSQGMCGSRSGSIPTDVGQPAIRISSITVGGTSNA
jgi:hypothetical protein